LLTVGPGVPVSVRNVADLVRWAKVNPDKANFGHPAPGSVPHLLGMTFDRMTGAGVRNISYKGGAPLLQDLLGRQMPIAFNVTSEVLTHVRTGRLRWRSVASPQRRAALPDVPTLAEAGVGDVTAVEFLGWYAPAKTSPATAPAASRRRSWTPRGACGCR
jgi:tripartite-type tricarboxylate transporter receptor subunit TctC